MKKIPIIIFLLICANTVSTQVIDSLLRECIVKGNFNVEWEIRENPNTDFQDIFEQAINYSKSTDRDIRYNAFLVAHMALTKSNVSEDSIVTFILSFPCKDEDYGIRKFFNKILIKTDRNAFSKHNIELFKEVLHDKDKITGLTILLAGYLQLINEKEYIRSFIEGKSGPLYTREEEWTAYLALTRMGEQKYIDVIMNYINKESDYDNVVFNLKYLAYVQHSTTTDYIVDLLMGNKKFIHDKNLYARKATRALGEMLKDTPIKVVRGWVSISQIQVARDWIKNRKANEPWSYNKDNFW